MTEWGYEVYGALAPSRDVYKRQIERFLKTPVYFAPPYQSWDKPHIEYLNKLLRQFIPKSSTFEDLTDADLRRFQNLLSEPTKQ